MDENGCVENGTLVKEVIEGISLTFTNESENTAYNRIGSIFQLVFGIC